MAGNNQDSRDKFDHSDHPTDRKLPDDLHAPNGANPARREPDAGPKGQPDPVNRRT
jgi:hypothetical protein